MGGKDCSTCCLRVSYSNTCARPHACLQQYMSDTTTKTRMLMGNLSKSLLPHYTPKRVYPCAVDTCAYIVDTSTSRHTPFHPPTHLSVLIHSSRDHIPGLDSLVSPVSKGDQSCISSHYVSTINRTFKTQRQLHRTPDAICLWK